MNEQNQQPTTINLSGKGIQDSDNLFLELEQILDLEEVKFQINIFS